VWEIRVVVGFDPVGRHSVQRSFTVHGDEDAAQRRRQELVADFGVSRVNFTTEAARLTVAELMERFFEAPHLWKPATVRSHRHVVRALMADDLGRRRLVTVTASEVCAAIRRWQEAGLSVATVSGRWLVLRSAVSWAAGEGILRSNPLAGMRGPARPEPRMHHNPTEVRALLAAAQAITNAAADGLATEPGSLQLQRGLFAAEQTLVLVRLAADSAARRGELAALRLGDLDGRILTIERGLSDGVIGMYVIDLDRRGALGMISRAGVLPCPRGGLCVGS